MHRNLKILQALKTGFFRTVKTWKVIIIFWTISYLTVSLLVVPLKASLKSALGNSMITEKLVKGIDIDVLGDLGANLHSMASFLSSGIIMLFLTAVFLNIFITGGLFGSVKKDSAGLLTENFFRASAKNFWSYLIITLMLYFIIIALIIILVVIPVSVASTAESSPEGMVFRILVVCMSVFVFAMLLLVLVADYSRAWQASQVQNDAFGALGFGFRQTFRTFAASFPMMLILILFQAIVVWVVIKVTGSIIPSKEGGVFLLFIISQLLFFLKLFLKVLRYGSVTALMEQDFHSKVPPQDQPLIYYAEPAELNIEFKPSDDT
jgi:hypothetical protein